MQETRQTLGAPHGSPVGHELASLATRATCCCHVHAACPGRRHCCDREMLAQELCDAADGAGHGAD